MDFNVRLENLIQENNLTQKQLAFDINVSKSTISDYIKGYRQPGYDILIRLARYFDVSTDYLLGLSPEKRPAPSALSPTEAELIRIYRFLIPRHQKNLMSKAKYYRSFPE